MSFAERKAESFRQRDSILRIWIMKRFGPLIWVMACSQITGAIMVFLATKMVGHLFENLFFRRGKKSRSSDVRLAFGRLDTLLGDMKWGAFEPKVTVVFSSPGRVFGQNHPTSSV